ncbi:putative vacuolar membrane protein [Neolecta irregularis DAH-3]|uniref:Putative vacuolar membrane protein n=1 Tax=Neolecta irregularis (strain DAH-3) TaxID=1198029 RepID=A0A1U7LS77_NEOID|nr:putative vacuolar membrane protein [Neolecta irregularis DAH-3]|eukprot:OLL25371.1 putative vacuolar membrane protein [Neolecta irregularis DAH-3]
MVNRSSHSDMPFDVDIVHHGRFNYSEINDAGAGKKIKQPGVADQKWTMASIALVFALIAIVAQTETAVYIQGPLGYSKPYFMLYLTHSSAMLLAPLQFFAIKLTRRQLTFKAYLRSHIQNILSTARIITASATKRNQSDLQVVQHMIWVVALCTCCLTLAACTWYIAVSMTTASDVTAIYNSSTFSAYAFSVLLLNERVRRDKIFAVVMSIIGVLIISYGGPKAPNDEGDSHRQLVGNFIIAGGSIVYGLYEVLYKKLACPNDVSPRRSCLFANVFTSGIGVFTIFFLWIPLPVLHVLGWEKFERPPREAVVWLLLTMLSNLIFSGSFLAMISLTSPVFSSVASMLSIFLVAITDMILTGKPLTGTTLFGSSFILAAFGVLGWATWKEMEEETLSEQSLSDLDEDEINSLT